MPLSAGDRLGSYEILASLGAGGMGEVYRARDTRLGREAAVKVLPEELARDPDRLGRFEQEARAASALNHPNIVTIYEVGFEAGQPFLAMELVDGRSLREVMIPGALPLRRMLGIGTQIAEGLAKAHSVGIVHRDLKPENVMVSRDGFVKILDFGLAKLTDLASGGVSAMPTLAKPETRSGVVLGTVGYMSPEQASGEPVDFRSDQFSLGSILYEMATGQKPFPRKTAAETMSAIIREEPEPAGKLRADLPVPARWILDRCLAKDPEERYGSTRDLARELSAIRDHISEVSSGGAILAAGRPRRRLMPAVAALALLASGLLGWLLVSSSRARPVSAPPTFKRLTYRQGVLQNARIAPDARTVYYGATWDGEPDAKVYVSHLDSPESRALDLPLGTDIAAVSSTGELAIILDQGPRGGTLARVPMAGGAPRQVVELVPYASADWAPDGKDLVVVRDVKEEHRLEFPIGKVILSAPGLVPSSPRFSPGGDRIAFWELGETSSIAVIEPSGANRRTLTSGWPRVAGVPDWSPDGSEVWFTAGRPGEPDSLWAVDGRSGNVRLVARVPGHLELDDISRDGRVLLAHHTVLYGLRGMGPHSPAERDLAWLDASTPADLSADGKTLLLTEQGEGAGASHAVYLRGTDGSPAVRLGEGVGFALAPDGKSVLARLEPGGGKPEDLALLPTGPGEIQRLKTGSIPVGGWGGFLPDGKSIVFASGRWAVGGARIYRLDLSGGAPRPIGPAGTSLWPFATAVSPDGKFVVARRALGGRAVATLLPLDGGDPREIPGWGGGSPVQWTADSRSLYVSAFSGEAWLVDIETGKKRLWKTFAPGVGPGLNQNRLRVTPDGKAYVYSLPRAFSELYLVEGLR
jgi:serine/threonine protein kinase/Tol biopolymer transport system component